MQPRDKQVIDKIIAETDVLSNIVEDISLDKFLDDEIVKRAASMTLINIGELVKSLSDEVRLANKNIPWRLIAGFRDIAAHKYQTLNMTDVWHTITDDVPVFKAKLNSLLVRDK
ncbi:MAG: DUF86 domain-containing protein [Coriobacteriales bacterium]|jgi:uncharacterized protein with HEPN domain|nr:DUF86 domain-containing protein [Coriobacteriales bacterium]